MRWPWESRSLEEEIARAKLRASRRRPWRRALPPGELKISDRWAVELYRGSLASSERLAELEAEIVMHQADARRAEAQSAALKVLMELDRSHVCRTTTAKVDLPLTSEGLLHEDAFRLLVDAQIWKHREQQLATALAATNND